MTMGKMRQLSFSLTQTEKMALSCDSAKKLQCSDGLLYFPSGVSMSVVLPVNYNDL